MRNNRVAVIGLGAMGLPMAHNLVKSGVDTYVWNRSRPSLEKAEEFGGKYLELDQLDCAIVITMLPDLIDVESVLAAGLESSLHSGDILVVMGTVSPVAVVELGKKLSCKGIRTVDAPVSGGDVGAINATLSIMVGASEKDFADVLPIFEMLGKTIIHLGPLGSGEIAKACNQIIVGGTLTAIAEAVNLGRKAGLDTKALIDILAGGLAGSAALNVKREKIESGDFSPGGSSKYQLKDLKFALEAGDAFAAALPATEIVKTLYEAMVAHGDGELDHSAIIREIERRK